VARKGGVYGVTRGLLKAGGPARVFDTLLDEQAFWPCARCRVVGAAPDPGDPVLATCTTRGPDPGEGATLQFFSNRQYRNPMVVRVAAMAIRRASAGTFTTTTASPPYVTSRGHHRLAVRPDDAAAMLHACVAAARASGVVCIYLEPIALYHTRDLYDAATSVGSQHIRTLARCRSGGPEPTATART